MALRCRNLTVGMAALALLGLSSPARAHNGAVAIAVPVAGITIDGDLSDWPQDMRRYPIALPEYGDKPKDEQDFLGSFWIGYNARENALYIAVEVQDESTVIDRMVAADWSTQDGCEVYVDVAHEEKASPAMQYAVYGEGRRAYGYGAEARSENAEVRIQREGNRHRYEWRIDIGRMSQGEQKAGPGEVMGVDVVVCDKDEDGSFSWVAWGSGISKGTAANRRGDVVLVEGDEATGVLWGGVKWEDRRTASQGAGVRIQSSVSAGLWVLAGTGQQNSFEVELPAGRYRVEARYQSSKAKGREVEVKGGSREWVGEVFVAKSPTQKIAFGDIAELTDREIQTLLREVYAKDIVIALKGASKEVKEKLLGNMSARVRGFIEEEMRLTTVDSGQVKESRERILRILSQLVEEGHLLGTPVVDEGLRSLQVALQAELQTAPFSQRGFGEIAEVIARMAEIARRGGILALEGIRDYVDDEILNDALGLAVDGMEPVLIKDMMTTRKQTLMQHQETRCRMVIEGVLAIQAGDNPRIVSHKLQNFFMPTLKPAEDRYRGASVNKLKEELQRRPFSSMDLDEMKAVFTSMAEIARREGVLALEQLAVVVDDELLKNSLYFLMEGTPPDLLHDMLTTRMVALLKDREMRYQMGIDGIVAIQAGETPAQVEAAMRNLYGGREESAGEDTGVRQWQSFGAKDGLANTFVHCVWQDKAGDLWFGTEKGAWRYNGKEFKAFTPADGLAGNNVSAILQDREGNIWFGHRGLPYPSRSGAVTRYDGYQFKAFMVGDDSLGDRGVTSMLQDREDRLWCGALGGMSRYDGRVFAPFTPMSGSDFWVTSILEDREGHLWFGTSGRGVGRYDGAQFTAFKTGDGLASDWVYDILQDREGRLWFATHGGVSRYDGSQFTTLTTKDGLASNWVQVIMEDQEGHLWFGTWGGGISLYDGLVIQNLRRQDGLAHDSVRDMLQDRNGDVWIATEGGIARYRPHRTPPSIQLNDVVADRRYGPVAEIRLPTSQQSIAFEFQGTSSKTRPGQVVYVYQLKGHEKGWQSTHEGRVEYQNLPPGGYVFQVKAVDRDLTYSEAPAEIRVAIHLPYGQMALVGGLGAALVGLIMTSGYALRRRRDLRRAERALMQEMEEELQTAHEMQMGLMPRESPRIEGLEIAGRCLPANHVGGDFFQYFPADGRLSICLADVTGHAMEAAIPVVMFSGVLKTEIRHDTRMEALFANLNQTLCESLDRHTFICFAMGELDPARHTFRLSNSGCPYPYHFRAGTGEVVELQVNAYPLGIRPDTTYPVIEVQLEPGDRVVFCSDGIIEAGNIEGELFGFERTAETIRQGCQEGLSTEALLERLMAEVKGFRGKVPQGDDQTVVVLKVLKV